MWFLSDVFTMGVQYGKRTEMCELFASAEFNKNYVLGLHNFAKSKGVTVNQYDAVAL